MTNQVDESLAALAATPLEVCPSHEANAPGVPCPFCDPAGYTASRWPNGYEAVWLSDLSRVPYGAELHFHLGASLWWTATHPDRGEERVLIRDADNTSPDNDPEPDPG